MYKDKKFVSSLSEKSMERPDRLKKTSAKAKELFKASLTGRIG